MARFLRIPASWRTEANHENGFVIATTALLLIPLMIFAAFAVDVGAWYVEADQAQRAADAAALASVAYTPNETAVTAAAVQVAAANGYVDQPGDFDPSNPTYPHVAIEMISEVEVKVTIITEGESFFGKVVLNGITIERYASADFTRPIPMGSPSSALGTGVDTEYPDDPDNFWLNILPPSTIRQNGDLITNPIASAGNTNVYHDPDGYLFKVDVPDTGGNYELQVRLTCHTWQSGELKMSLYPPDNTVTPAFLRDNLTIVTPLIADQIFTESPNSCDTSGDSGDSNSSDGYHYTDDPEDGTWQTVSTAIGAVPGDWVLQAEHNSGGRILYALRVINTDEVGANRHCTKLGALGDDCPTVSPINWLGIVTHFDMFQPANTDPTELYLADVADVNGRSTLRITMFDPADGIDEVKILMPPVDDNPATVRQYADFTWSVEAESGNPAYTPTAADMAECSGGDSCVTAPVGETGNWFQNKVVLITVDLTTASGGAPYQCGSNCWWKVEYSNDGSTTETTTWRADLIGDPIRLTE
ncbi:MAG: pilus assembly protein TadG-related protein [Acidimicrobiia bacterium]